MAGSSFSFSWFQVGKLHLKFQVLHGDILERTQAVQETWSNVFRLDEVLRLNKFESLRFLSFR